MSILTRFAHRRATQRAPIPGSGQVPNSAGGYAWAVDDWSRLRRFLILGTDGGTFYASDWHLTRENAGAVEACLDADGPHTVAEIVQVSTAGRAPKNDPAIFALAIAASHADVATRRAALAAIPDVCRTGTHLFQFANFVSGFRGWGSGLRRAVGSWYAGQEVEALAYQAVKYRQREGVTHRDLLRLAHPGRTVSAGNPTLAVSPAHADLFAWIVRGDTAGLPRIVEGFIRAQAAESPGEAAALVREDRLPREALTSDHLTSAEVWEALLEDMPVTAMVRNLATMTRLGVIAPGSAGTDRVLAQLGNRDRIRRARLHPIAMVSALRTYQSGHGARGRHTWTPVAQVIDALDAAFYDSFGSVDPAGQRMLLALDVSGSMGWGEIAGVPGLTPRVASAAMALVTAATEPAYEIVGFHSGPGAWRAGARRSFDGGHDGIGPLGITPRQRLDDALRAVDGLPFGATDCSLPMRYAQEQGREVDTFVIYTDSETWSGDIHPAQALADYRAASGIAARLVVVGMTANGFSIADPADAGMLDVVGFDTVTPSLIADFSRGSLGEPHGPSAPPAD